MKRTPKEEERTPAEHDVVEGNRRRTFKETRSALRKVKLDKNSTGCVIDNLGEFNLDLPTKCFCYCKNNMEKSLNVFKCLL